MPANSAYKVHAYAAIMAYGATPLFEVSGTKGPRKVRLGVAEGAPGAAGVVGVVPPPPPKLPPP